MTRKKFIKKLMALRLSRDSAVECANHAKSHGIPYFDMYWMFIDVLQERLIKEFEQYVLYGTDRTKWIKLRKEDLT